MEDQNNSKSFIKYIGGLLVVVLALVGFYWLRNSGSAKISDNTGGTDTPTPTVSPTPSAIIRKYKDGTYTAVGNYAEPASREEVTIELVIEGDIITSAKFMGKPANPTTKMMQGKFMEGFMMMVVGKPIDEVNLTVVNGSSLTPKGFMDALEKIKLQAKA
ncbi:hypothetical protein HYT00_01405 [Candidatus Giovannonibacteria bacterium]|nr:hypothetical protein [Candidatus Giovannonibacteria bacterium]